METAGKQQRLRSGLVILFCLFLPSFLPAVEAEWKDRIIENQRFTLKYLTSYGGRESVEIEDPVWPDGISKVSGPYRAQKTVQYEDGSHGTILQLVYTLRGNKPGIFTIPPLSVSDGESVQKSRFLRIPILRRDEAFLRYPLLLEWENIPESLYVGQAVPLILMMENMEEISLPDTVSLRAPASALLEQVRGLGDIGYTSLDENTLFHVPMQTWMLTPSRAGELSLASAQVKILGLTRKSGAQTLKVLPLPEEVSSSGGAVGDFRYTLDLPDRELAVDETVTLSIRVEGTGNLNYLELPEPDFPRDLTVVTKDLSDYRGMESGFEGVREMQYSISAQEKGDYLIHIPSFSWLNPGDHRVYDAASRDISMEVLSLMDSLKERDMDYTLLPEEDLRGAGSLSLFRNPLAYLLLLPGLLFLILSRLRKLRTALLFSSLLISTLFLSAALPGETDSAWIVAAEESFTQGEYETALAMYQRSARDWDDNWAYLYNRGILHFLNQENAEAVASLRKALYLSNNNGLVRGTLFSLEEQLGLDNQLELSLLLPPNLVFALFVLSFNLLFFSISWLLLRNSSLPVLFLLFFTLSMLLSGTELFRSLWLFNRHEAVVRLDIPLRKIPESGGSAWITIREGTSVELLSHYGNFTLVRSAYGLEGWMPGKDLIPVNGDSFYEIR